MDEKKMVEDLGGTFAQSLIQDEAKSNSTAAFKKKKTDAATIFRCCYKSCQKTAAQTAQKVLYKAVSHRGNKRYCYAHSLEQTCNAMEPCPNI